MKKIVLRPEVAENIRRIRDSSREIVHQVRENPFIKEFREFAMKGSVFDLAVGVIIGSAFTKIVTSFVSDILMPPFGLILGRIDLANLFIDFSGKGFTSLAQAKAAGAPTLNYGLFLNNVIDFLIVAFALFLIVRQINAMRRKEEAQVDDPVIKACPFCTKDIPAHARKCPECTADLA